MAADESLKIQDVSDTALWVATYRADETRRPDALFRDPYAERLCGAKGREIARQMIGSVFTGWTIVIRTAVIDEMILRLVRERGVDTVLNLGAGLDARPYRMELPAELRWIEADFPKMIEYKESVLGSERPRCRLDRRKVDLSNAQVRQALFDDVARDARRVLVLTEGVIPYLTNEQVADLADGLRAQPKFEFWIAEYFSREVVRFVKSPRRMKQMKNAPFQLNLGDWWDFFARHGWKATDVRYHFLEGLRLGRLPKFPLWMKLLHSITPRKIKEKNFRMFGYVLYEPIHTS